MLIMRSGFRRQEILNNTKGKARYVGDGRFFLKVILVLKAARFLTETADTTGSLLLSLLL